MATPTLGSILLGTTNPERLRAWYVAALSPEQSEDGFLDFGGVALLIDGRTDVAVSDRPPALASVVFGSLAPDVEIAWYQRALGLPPGHAAPRLAITQRDDVAPTAVEPMRI